MRKALLVTILLIILLVMASCSTSTTSKEEQNVDNTEITNEDETEENETENNENKEEKKEKDILHGQLKLNKAEGRIGDKVKLEAEELKPNKPLKVVYVDMEGTYSLKDNYSFIGTSYDVIERELLEGEADEDGKWSGTITIPDGFGDDHDILIYQEDQKVAKANFFVETVFTISPESGPAGTEIEIIGEGLSWKMYGSLWHLNYDNAYTGMLTGVSTNGRANGVIRAAGDVGPHTLTIESGSSGSPFMNRTESAINYIETHYFTFTITDEKPSTDLVYVEDVPEAAEGGIKLPDPENKDGVEISIDKEMGTVGEDVVLTGSGLPKDSDIVFDWHTMVGNRVTPEGYSPQVEELGKVKTDSNGSFKYPFTIPDDLGGLPHLIDVKVDDEIYGQTYLRILPSIVSITPSEGPPGTRVTVEIKGSGWTEFDNALAVTYDNAYVGYICGFNSQGTIKLPFIASGKPGYHMVDIYPSIYQGSMVLPDIYTKPQLTYRDDHPGTGIPAMRTFFKVTEE